MEAGKGTLESRVRERVSMEHSDDVDILCGRHKSDVDTWHIVGEPHPLLPWWTGRCVHLAYGTL